MSLLKRSNPPTGEIKILQFGEGNFLRAFIDWMVQELNDKAQFNGRVVMVKPRGGDVSKFNAQDCRYTLILRGIENGKPVEKRRLIDCVDRCLDAVGQWKDLQELSCLPSLRFLFSNTTEAGIVHTPEQFEPSKCPTTYPAKLTALLFQRFSSGLPGLYILPCELNENNGAMLKECISQYAKDWNLGRDFLSWLHNDCLFYNTLVDRIVAGYPANASEIEKELGYEDKLLDCGEIYHSLVLEGPAKLFEEMPFQKAGLNVIHATDLEPYRKRKVRFLNGAHTSSVLYAILQGLTYVDEMMNDKVLGPFVEKTVFGEIARTVQLPEQEKLDFAQSVMERFRNPYAQHRLLSISLNSVSKWRVRVLPSLEDYLDLTGSLPENLSFSLAALLRFYMIQIVDGKAQGSTATFTYPVSDIPEVLDFFTKAYATYRQNGNLAQYANAALAQAQFWGKDLNKIPGLPAKVTACLHTLLCP